MIQARGRGDHGVCDEEFRLFGCPVQDEGAWEVSAALDGRDTGEDGLGGAGDELSVKRFGVVGPREPFLVVGRDVDWAAEGAGPVQVCRVVMGMRNLVELGNAVH